MEKYLIGNSFKTQKHMSSLVRNRISTSIDILQDCYVVIRGENNRRETLQHCFGKRLARYSA